MSPASEDEPNLVLAAHPDDEVLGCGGTIRKLTSRGVPVHIAILGEGLTSRQPRREDTEPQEVQSLRERSERVAEVLGATGLSLFGLPDNRFDTVPLLEIAKMIESLVEEVRPTVVYTHHGGDLNMDHVLLFRATLIATRPQAEQCVRDVLAYEVPSSSEWSFQQFPPTFTPNVFEEIHQTLETKIEAMQLYDTESRPFPHPRSPEALRASAARWGAAAGVPAAEPFQLVRSVRGSE